VTIAECNRRLDDYDFTDLLEVFRLHILSIHAWKYFFLSVTLLLSSKIPLFVTRMISKPCVFLYFCMFQYVIMGSGFDRTI
jgi:hypothetical protein